MLGSSSLFILANWTSYSKSETALRPLNITVAECCFAKLTRRLWKENTSTCFSLANIDSANLTLSSTEKSVFLDGLSAIASNTLSKIFIALFTKSVWPFVMGSKVPG